MTNALILNLPTAIKFKLGLSLKIIKISVFILITSLLVLYIFQVNSLVGENYLLKNQERKLAEIKKEKEILEINFSQVSSLANLETYFQTQDFVKASQVKYIQILEASIVAGR